MCISNQVQDNAHYPLETGESRYPEVESAHQRSGLNARGGLCIESHQRQMPAVLDSLSIIIQSDSIKEQRGPGTN